MQVARLFSRIAGDAECLVEFFLNFDCDGDVSGEGVFECILSTLSRLAREGGDPQVRTSCRLVFVSFSLSLFLSSSLFLYSLPFSSHTRKHSHACFT